MQCPRCSVAEIPDSATDCPLCGYSGDKNRQVTVLAPDELDERVRTELGLEFQIESELWRSKEARTYLATNASGAHVLRHGYTRDHIVSLRAVLPDGELVQAGRHAGRPQVDTLDLQQDSDQQAKAEPLAQANAAFHFLAPGPEPRARGEAAGAAMVGGECDGSAGHDACCRC